MKEDYWFGQECLRTSASSYDGETGKRHVFLMLKKKRKMDKIYEITIFKHWQIGSTRLWTIRGRQKK